MIWLKYKFKTKGTWLKKVLKKELQVKKCNIMKCMSQYLRIMSLKMRWPWIWATFGIQTLNTWLEHWLLCPLLQSILNMYLHTSQKCWEWQFDDLNNKQYVWGAMVKKWINQPTWPTYYSNHYCIDAMKQYRCVAEIQNTLYCNMANQSLFARYCCIIIRMTIDHWCCLVAFDISNFNHEYISLVHKSIFSIILVLSITNHDMTYNQSVLQNCFYVPSLYTHD